MDASAKERIEALTRDREALQHTAELRLEENQRLRDERAQLSQKLAALQVDLNNPANLSTSVVERTRQYATLRTQYSQLLADFEVQRQQLAELQKGQTYFENCRADMQRLREVDDQKLEAMERHLQDVLGQLRESQKERNALAYRLEQKEAEGSLKTVSEALRKSHAVQEKEVARLRGEIQQLQRDISAYRAKQPLKPRFAGELELSQELETVTKSYEEMTDQVAKLSQQLADKEDTTLQVLKQVLLSLPLSLSLSLSLSALTSLI
jgi:chromosome segregation ATPase